MCVCVCVCVCVCALLGQQVLARFALFNTFTRARACVHHYLYVCVDCRFKCHWTQACSCFLFAFPLATQATRLLHCNPVAHGSLRCISAVLRYQRSVELKMQARTTSVIHIAQLLRREGGCRQGAKSRWSETAPKSTLAAAKQAHTHTHTHTHVHTHTHTEEARRNTMRWERTKTRAR